jgi:beta-N-acetylhexosaminidase
MLDVEGTSLNDDDIRRLSHPMTGGVILFARHFEDRAQLVALTDAIRAVRNDLLIAVDHEGGRVQRFRTDGFTVLPAMRRLGELWDEDVLFATNVATATGFILAAELRACGIDMSFTPVLDLDYGGSQVIGDRAFHRDPRVVALLAKSVSHGLALAGMSNCGKHFPGHGFATADSHVALATDERPLEAILREDAAPYGWLGIALASVIPAHVIYAQVDDKPAGFSRIWLEEILRGKLGFTGAIISDDLSMEAARAGGTLTEAATAALEAGCDMVLVCNQPRAAEVVLDELQHVPSKASTRRLRRLRARGKPPTWPKLIERADYQEAQALLRRAFK